MVETTETPQLGTNHRVFSSVLTPLVSATEKMGSPTGDDRRTLTPHKLRQERTGSQNDIATALVRYESNTSVRIDYSLSEGAAFLEQGFQVLS